MAETLISPGVLSRENDQSFLRALPVTVGAAIIGPTVKGPVEIPTICTSYSDFQSKFGTTLISASYTYTYFTSIAAYNYFINGGQTLLVARAVHGAYTPATSSAILNNILAVTGAFASASLDLNILTTADTASWAGININVDSTHNFWFIPNTNNYSSNIEVPSQGEYVYYIGSPTSYTAATWASLIVQKINSASLEASSWFNASTDGTTLFLTASNPGTAPNGIYAVYSQSYAFSNGVFASYFAGGTTNTTANAFVLETISEGTIMNSDSAVDAYGALASGSVNNIRFQIANADTGSGTFSLIIRRGDDTTTNQTVLESWTGLTLDPNSSRFISAQIGDIVQSYNPTTNQIDITGTYPNASRYVRVKQVNYPTLNYLDNSGTVQSQYTSSIPINSSGAFGSALGTTMTGSNFYENIDSSNTQGLIGTDYDNMIALLSNKDDYKFNLLLTPGLYNKDYTSQCTSIIDNTQNRGDNIFILDLVAYASSVSSVTSQASSRNTSYAASYWPWVLVYDPDSGKRVWVPASTVIGGVYAFNDKVSYAWFAPAGINRGGLGQVVRAEQKLNQSQRDTLYNNKVNPIATFPGTGTVVYGQKTLQTKASALDRVNVRRLLIELKNYIGQVALNLVFEQNTIATRNSFLAQTNPYLASVQQRQGLYAFKVVMDETNNTPDVIDRNQLVGAIYLQPTKTAEFIYLNFNLTPTGVNFE